MVLIKIKNQSIRLEHPLVNSGNFLLGLKALTFTGFKYNLIRIKTDCVITIGGVIVNVEQGKYTIEQLNKKINPVVISLSENNVVAITCDTYYHLDEHFCKYLNIEYKKLDYSKLVKKPLKQEPCLNIEKDCSFDVKWKDRIEMYTLNKNYYTVKQFEKYINTRDIFGVNTNTTEIVLENNILKMTTLAKFSFDKDLSKYLGLEYDSNNNDPFIPIKSSEAILGVKSPNIKLTNVFNNVEGTMKTEKRLYSLLKNNYTIEKLNAIFPKTVQLNITDHKILVQSDQYFKLDKTLCDSLGVEYITEFMVKGFSPIIVENEVLEVHCDIVEKSFSSVNDTHHVEEELLFVFLFDPNNLFVKPEKILYVPVSPKIIKTINISIFDQEGNEILQFNDPIFYLDLLDKQPQEKNS